MDENQDEEQMTAASLLGPGLIHEMRHPLMGIKAGMQLLSQQLGKTVSALEDWQMMSAQVARLEELFRTYQELFTPPLRLSDFEVEPVVQRAIDLLAWRLRRLGARFAWQRGVSQQGSGSPQAVLHATTNLLMNALDAIEEAGGSGRVAVRMLQIPGEIRISDEGIGIPASVAGQIFQPRFTTKPQGKGTGLGLHIARQAMQRSGGDVRLVDPGDSLRLPWARTEFAIMLGRAG
ncbi:MAG TPA: HAMP domain-containing sensor histidine kinase [Myxococcales bacterium]|jgi:signal transduction histidine kinase|nr:HAMP domain-containing sensor histidine kinase [Myxococcales bacterium]